MFQIKTKLVVGLIIFFVFEFSFAIVSFKSSESIGETKFLAIGNPSAIRIEGKGQAPVAEIQVEELNDAYRLKMSVKVDLEKLSTGIDLRDKHMKKNYLETEKFSVATVQISDLVLKKTLFKNKEPQEINFEGILSLHGYDKTIKGILKITEQQNNRLLVHSKFDLKLSDYQFKIPTFAGITVADKVEVETSNQVEIF